VLGRGCDTGTTRALHVVSSRIWPVTSLVPRHPGFCFKPVLDAPSAPMRDRGPLCPGTFTQPPFGGSALQHQSAIHQDRPGSQPIRRVFRDDP